MPKKIYSSAKERNRAKRIRLSKTAPSIYRFLKFRAKKQKVGIMTLEEFKRWYEHTFKNCFYCGIPEELAGINPVFNQGSTGLIKRLTVDRLQGRLGYTNGNIVLACYVCNMIKGPYLTAVEMQEIARKYIRPKWEFVEPIKNIFV